MQALRLLAVVAHVGWNGIEQEQATESLPNRLERREDLLTVDYGGSDLQLGKDRNPALHLAGRAPFLVVESGRDGGCVP